MANRYYGDFTDDDMLPLDNLVSGWTFWNIGDPTSMYPIMARYDATPDGRLGADTVEDLCRKLALYKRFG